MRTIFSKILTRREDVLAGLIVSLILLTPAVTVARILYTGTAGIATNELTNRFIADEAINNRTVSGTAAIAWSKISTGGSDLDDLGERNIGDSTGTLTFSRGGLFVTSVVSGGIPFWDSTVSVSGSNLLTQRAIMLGGGAAAAPYTLAGLGSSGEVLTSNGSGSDPSFQAVGGFTSVANQQVTVNVTSVSVVLSASRRNISGHLHWEATTTNGDRTPEFQFNWDVGANYSWRCSRNNAAAVSGSSETKVATHNAGIANDIDVYFQITNLATTAKTIILDVVDSTGSGSVPSESHCVGVWNNTTSAISQILIDAQDDFIATGTRIDVWSIN